MLLKTIVQVKSQRSNQVLKKLERDGCVARRVGESLCCAVLCCAGLQHRLPSKQQPLLLYTQY